jgi:hypothetical protein
MPVAGQQLRCGPQLRTVNRVSFIDAGPRGFYNPPQIDFRFLKSAHAPCRELVQIELPQGFHIGCVLGLSHGIGKLLFQ